MSRARGGIKHYWKLEDRSARNAAPHFKCGHFPPIPVTSAGQTAACQVACRRGAASSDQPFQVAGAGVCAAKKSTGAWLYKDETQATPAPQMSGAHTVQPPPNPMAQQRRARGVIGS